MKRATITISDDLEPALDAYLRDQEVAPSLTRLLQAALRDFLSSRGYVGPPTGASAAAASRTTAKGRNTPTPDHGEASETDTTLL